MPSTLRSIMGVLVGYLALWFAFISLTALFHQVLHGNWNAAPLLFAQLAISLIACGLGGYVCALIADHRPLLHAGVIAAIMLLSSLKSFSGLRGQLPTWYLITAMVCTPLAVIAGAACDFQELSRRK